MQFGKYPKIHPFLWGLASLKVSSNIIELKHK